LITVPCTVLGWFSGCTLCATPARLCTQVSTTPKKKIGLCGSERSQRIAGDGLIGGPLALRKEIAPTSSFPLVLALAIESESI
jgi:hypothetical protein